MKNFTYLLIPFLYACQNVVTKNHHNTETVVHNESEIILISKDKDKSFIKWLSNIDTNNRYIDVYDLNNIELDSLLKICDGVLIAGGNDVNASIYGKSDEIERCGNFDKRRDTLEIKMISYAFENKVPLLCVCRGEQILNVSQGGTLIIDIPTDFKSKIDHSGKIKKKHFVHVEKESLLYEISHVDSIGVNSFHHQASENLGKNLIVSAHSSDGLIEAIELRDKSKHPFVLGVQWHPELLDTSNIMSNPIGRRFLMEVKK